MCITCSLFSLKANTDDNETLQLVGQELNWVNSNATEEKKIIKKIHLGQIPVQTHHPVKAELELAQRRR